MTFMLRVVLFGLVLLGLLTWLLARSFVPVMPDDVVAERAVAGFALAESDLRSDMLAARAGLLQNYDPLVRDMDAMRKWSAQLRASPEGSGERGQGLPALVNAREDVLEDFKSENAILQNLLAAFDVLSSRLTHARIDPNLALAVGTLASIITHLAREPSADAMLSAKFWLDAMTYLKFAPADADDAASLAQRGRMLIHYIPKVDDLLRREQALSTEPQIDGIQDALHHERDHRQAVSSWFRLALYGAALIVSALLLRAGFGLRSRTQELQNRIYMEAAIRKASNLFVSCPPEEIDARLEDALALLGEASDADRAYVLTTETPRANRLWCNLRATPPAGWPESVRDPLWEAIGFVPRSFRKSTGDPALPSRLSARLRAEGMTAISCAKLWREDEVVGLVGFERSLPRMRGLDAISLDIVADVIGAALLRRAVFRSRSELERKLRKAERLEAVGTFATGIAHNFNNVLGVITGQAEMATAALEAGGDAVGHVRQITDAGAHARDVASQILQFGRSEQGIPQPVEARALLADTLRQVAAASGRALPMTASTDGARTLADVTQLQQAFFNVVQNAVQASTASVPILISLDRVISAGQHLSHGELAAGSYVRVCVSDRGRGMHDAEQARMFQPFFTTRGGGTGLGLATAYDTVSAIGGAFHVRSAPDQGTTVEIWLPEATDSQVSAATGSTVLMLGTDPESMEHDEDLLAALGYEPVGFIEAQRALRALRAEPDGFDLAIIDQTALRRNGDELIRAFRAALPQDRPVVLSLAEGERGAEMETKPGISAVLQRPWRSAAVAATLARAQGTQN